MTRKPTPSLDIPTPRSDRAKQFITGTGEDVSTEVAKPAKKESKHYKAAVRYMKENGIENVESIDFLRLNCELPKELHQWLNVYARSSDEYSSMTEIVIEQLGKFARERGFTVKKR